MKVSLTALLIAAFLAAVRLAGAQVLNEDVGIPLGSAWNSGGAIVVIGEAGVEGQVTPIGTPGLFSPAGYATASPGDLIISTDGVNSPSDWLADIRFFNPLDPTGTLGLPATETEAFFPGDLGPGGFGSFQLMPNYYITLTGFTNPGVGAVAAQVYFGPVGSIEEGQEGIILFSAFASGTPEPGSLGLLIGAGAAAVACFVRRRRLYAARFPAIR